MNSLVAFLSPLALLLPFVAAELPVGRTGEPEPARAAPEPDDPALGFGEAGAAPLRLLEEAREPGIVNQVRIEQRVIIRIAPSTPRQMAPLEGADVELEERDLEGCVPIDSIAAVRPGENNRLLLFMRDRRVLTAQLERSCNARDYYSGFYVERSGDGRICARRDKLQSRAGSNCRVAEFHRLVAVRD